MEAALLTLALKLLREASSGMMNLMQVGTISLCPRNALQNTWNFSLNFLPNRALTGICPIDAFNFKLSNAGRWDVPQRLKHSLQSLSVAFLEVKYRAIILPRYSLGKAELLQFCGYGYVFWKVILEITLFVTLVWATERVSWQIPTSQKDGKGQSGGGSPIITEHRVKATDSTDNSLQQKTNIDSHARIFDKHVCNSRYLSVWRGHIEKW